MPKNVRQSQKQPKESEKAKKNTQKCPRNAKHTRFCQKVQQSHFGKPVGQPGLPIWYPCGMYTDGKVDRTKASGCPKGSSDDLAFYVTHFSKKSPVQRMMTLVSVYNNASVTLMLQRESQCWQLRQLEFQFEFEFLQLQR